MIQINVSAQKHAPQINIQTVKGIYPESSTRILKYSDNEGLTSWDFKIMRNEIYARKGYIFKTNDMNIYFRRTTWYNPRYTNIDKLLTKIEKINIDYIKSFE